MKKEHFNKLILSYIYFILVSIISAVFLKSNTVNVFLFLFLYLIQYGPIFYIFRNYLTLKWFRITFLTIIYLVLFLYLSKDNILNSFITYILLNLLPQILFTGIFYTVLKRMYSWPSALLLTSLMFCLSLVPSYTRIMTDTMPDNSFRFTVMNVFNNVGPLFAAEMICGLLFTISDNIWIPAFIIYINSKFHYSNLFVIILVLTFLYYGTLWYVKKNTDFKFKEYL